ncbi:MAG: hypothetical protein JWN56_1893 [Sphingobacteriales bacterium]|nr:hypothetical protein [Sphingobacteriales bacterium]
MNHQPDSYDTGFRKKQQRKIDHDGNVGMQWMKADAASVGVINRNS